MSVNIRMRPYSLNDRRVQAKWHHLIIKFDYLKCQSTINLNVNIQLHNLEAKTF